MEQDFHNLEPVYNNFQHLICSCFLMKALNWMLDDETLVRKSGEIFMPRFATAMQLGSEDMIGSKVQPQRYVPIVAVKSKVSGPLN
jgi:hypothetical protein